MLHYAICQVQSTRKIVKRSVWTFLILVFALTSTSQWTATSTSTIVMYIHFVAVVAFLYTGVKSLAYGSHLAVDYHRLYMYLRNWGYQYPNAAIRVLPIDPTDIHTKSFGRMVQLYVYYSALQVGGAFAAGVLEHRAVSPLGHAIWITLMFMLIVFSTGTLYSLYTIVWLKLSHLYGKR